MMAVAYAPSIGIIYGEVIYESPNPPWMTIEAGPTDSWFFVPGTWDDGAETEDRTLREQAR